MIKKILSSSILVLAMSFSSNLVAEGILKWQELDKQELQYVKDVYSGNYSQVKEHFSSEYDKKDMVNVFNNAVIYDEFGLHEYCHYCGTAFVNKKTYSIGVPEKFDFNRSKSASLYSKAMSLGHPYAGYMEYRQAIISESNSLTNHDKNIIYRRLKKHADGGDGVASFMFYYLKGTLRMRPSLSPTTVKRRQSYIDKTVELLEQEAKDGRILAMFYLAVTYRINENHTKSLAWFMAAARHGHWQSSQYVGDTLNKLQESGKEKPALDYLSEVLGYYDMTLAD